MYLFHDVLMKLGSVVLDISLNFLFCTLMFFKGFMSAISTKININHIQT